MLMGGRGGILNTGRLLKSKTSVEREKEDSKEASKRGMKIWGIHEEAGLKGPTKKAKVGKRIQNVIMQRRRK